MKIVQIEKGALESLVVMSSVVEARDRYTGGHIWRVSQYAKLLANHMGLSPDEVFITELSGLVHDLGKITIPEKILNKKSALSDDEYKIIKSHTDTGHEMLRTHPLYGAIADSIKGHHTRVDGGGYPDNLEPFKSPLIPQIISLADAFDAMTSQRSYRNPIDTEKVRMIIFGEKDKQFNGKLVNEFVHLLDNNRLKSIMGHSNYDRPMLSCEKCGPVISVNEDISDGQSITCPACHTELIAHRKDSSFEFESIGSNKLYIPKADYITASNFTKEIPTQISF